MFKNFDLKAQLIYEGCHKSSTYYFVMLAHKIRGRCWWYGSRGWIFLLILLYMLLLCEKSSRGTIWQNGIWHGSMCMKEVCMMKVCMMEVCMNVCGTEFLHALKMAASDIHWHLMDISGDQTVDLSTVRQWVVCFSSGNSNMKDKPRSRVPCITVITQNKGCLNELICMNQLMVVTVLKNSFL